MLITEQQCKKISKYLVPYHEAVNRCFLRYDITNILRQTSFLAQTAHESGNFKWKEELGGKDYFDMYEGRKDLGNTEDGDGYRYKGRGFIQLTGRYNYRKFSEDFEPNFEENPELVSEDPFVILVAGWYWNKHNINELSDMQDHKAVTRAINGGLNGYEDRIKHYKRIWDILYDW